MEVRDLASNRYLAGLGLGVSALFVLGAAVNEGVSGPVLGLPFLALGAVILRARFRKTLMVKAGLFALCAVLAGAGGTAHAGNPDGAPKVDAGNSSAAEAGTTDTAAGAGFGAEVVRAAIGSGQGQIGVDTAQEAWSSGPMSFAVASNGEIFVLDQHNSRIQVYLNNAWLRAIPIGGTTYVDMDLMKNGGFALLDNLVKKMVVVLDARGNKLQEIPLKGRSIPDPAAADGVQCRGDGIWVELDHGKLVQVGDSDGAPVANRVVVRGAFTWDGSRLMQSSILGDITANVRVSETDKVTWKNHAVYYKRAIMNLLGLFSDSNGNFYLGTVLVDDAGVGAAGAELTVLNSSGAVVKRTRMFAQTRTEEVSHSLRVVGDGTAYQLALDDKGVAVRRYDP